MEITAWTAGGLCPVRFSNGMRTQYTAHDRRSYATDVGRRTTRIWASWTADSRSMAIKPTASWLTHTRSTAWGVFASIVCNAIWGNLAEDLYTSTLSGAERMTGLFRSAKYLLPSPMMPQLRKTNRHTPGCRDADLRRLWRSPLVSGDTFVLHGDETMDRVTLRIPEQQIEAVEQLVETGQYPNRSEAIRSAVRNLVDQEFEAEAPRHQARRKPSWAKV